MKIIGIDIGGTEIKGALFDKVILKESKRKTKQDLGKEAIMLNLIELIKDLWVEEVKAIGIVTAGAVDIERGIITNNVGTLKGWVNFCIKEEVELIFKVPCFIENDANGALIAEVEGYQNIENACMITLGTGVGTAAYINGKLYRGQNYKIEFGHSILIPNGRECTCKKKGCAESYLSGNALKKTAIEEVDAKIKHGKELFELYQLGNKSAEKVIDDYTDLLALFIHNICMFYDPQLIIIGGGLICQKDILFEFLSGKTKDLDALVVPAKLGNFAGVKGAYLIASNGMKNGKD
jgi:glucokinase